MQAASMGMGQLQSTVLGVGWALNLFCLVFSHPMVVQGEWRFLLFLIAFYVMILL